MPIGIAELVGLFDLEIIEQNIFRASSLAEPRLRVFGGQVAAQALVAAGRTVEEGRVHSLHAYFLRPGDPKRPILYEVDRIRDGRSFTTRRVLAIQKGEAIFNLDCSFHHDEVGLEHGDEIPMVPPPESLEPVRLTDEGAELASRSFLLADGLDIRFVTTPPWQRAGHPEPHQQLWLKTTDRLSDDPLLHAAFATFASDLTLVDTVLMQHGHSPWDESFLGASLDHCMWFHRNFRADDWLLCDATSPVAHGARGLAIGALYNTDGARVASVAQEGLVRLRDRS